MLRFLHCQGASCGRCPQAGYKRCEILAVTKPQSPQTVSPWPSFEFLGFTEKYPLSCLYNALSRFLSGRANLSKGWHHCLNEHKFEQTPGDREDGKPGELQSLRSQRVGQDVVTEEPPPTFPKGVPKPRADSQTRLRRGLKACHPQELHHKSSLPAPTGQSLSNGLFQSQYGFNQMSPQRG